MTKPSAQNTSTPARLETERLIIRPFTITDASFIRQLLNDPAFIRNIGNKGVKTESDAINYLEQGPLKSYQQYGFGLAMLELKKDHTPIGMCGLIKRDELHEVDVGYALMPDFWHQGYAKEALLALIDQAQTVFALKSLVAITSLDNPASVKLLEATGFISQGIILFNGEQTRLFRIILEPKQV